MMAMLLAAGRGERMRPLTDHTPKPLLRAGGKPLIVWHIERLVHASITRLVINHAHLGARLEEELGDGSRFGARIQYSPEPPGALETAGGIAYALPLLCPQPGGEGEAFAVINSDIYCDYEFSRLHEFGARLAAGGDLAHLVLVDNPSHHPKGDFLLHGGRVIPEAQPAGSGPKLTFSGIGVYRAALFAGVARGSSAPLAPLLRAAIAREQVSGEHYTGRWVDVGTPQRLEQLDKLLRPAHNGGHV
jgi:MurNAc alpha-1-phosphate uridylyltransferase